MDMVSLVLNYTVVFISKFLKLEGWFLPEIICGWSKYFTIFYHSGFPVVSGYLVGWGKILKCTGEYKIFVKIGLNGNFEYGCVEVPPWNFRKITMQMRKPSKVTAMCVPSIIPMTDVRCY